MQRILDFFNNDVLPIVYDRGSLGASGDLAPLANLSFRLSEWEMCIIREEEGGNQCPGRVCLEAGAPDE